MDESLQAEAAFHLFSQRDTALARAKEAAEVARSELAGHLNDENFWAMLDARDAVHRAVKHNPCPECSAVQVRCLEWRGAPLWRCRECRHTWHWTPTPGGAT